MKFGLNIPSSWGIEDAEALLALGPLAEELGYDSVWVSHHLFNAGYVVRRIGHGPYYEPLTTLTYLSATTSTIRLGTSVMVLPYIQPIHLAKVVATLDVFSGGRVNLGVGAGSVEDEFEGLGANFAQRGSATDEAIEVMVTLWTQETPSYQGKYHSFSGMAFSPKPAQVPYPPIYVGGSTRPAIRRAARIGNWWHPNALSTEDLQIGIHYLSEQALSNGRDPSDIKVSLRFDLDFPVISGRHPTPDSGARSRPYLTGTPGDMIETLKAYVDLGVEQVLVATMSNDVKVVQETARLFASEVMLTFRE